MKDYIKTIESLEWKSVIEVFNSIKDLSAFPDHVGVLFDLIQSDNKFRLKANSKIATNIKEFNQIVSDDYLSRGIEVFSFIQNFSDFQVNINSNYEALIFNMQDQKTNLISFFDIRSKDKNIKYDRVKARNELRKLLLGESSPKPIEN